MLSREDFSCNTSCRPWGPWFSLTISYNHKQCAVGSGYCYDETQKEYVVEHNIIRHCTTKNIDECVMLRGDKVKFNLIEDVTSLSYGTLRIQNSASYNTFNRCHIKNSYYWKDKNSSSIYRTPGVDFLQVIMAIQRPKIYQAQKPTHILGNSNMQGTITQYQIQFSKM